MRSIDKANLAGFLLITATATTTSFLTASVAAGNFYNKSIGKSISETIAVKKS
jgi:hypothetical protein